MVLALVAALGLAWASARPGSAQDMRTLEMRDGIVRVDGKEVQRDQLPESLRDSDLNLVFSWTGTDAPVVEIGERFYAVDTDGIREVDASQYPSARQRYFEALGSIGEGTWYSTGADDAATRKQVEALYEQAQEMTELSEQLSRRRVEDSEKLADEIRKQAEMAERMAVEIPRMNVTTYWDAVRESDESLYQQLVQEWKLESTIQALAARVRAANESSQREKLVAELRDLLGSAFELKQENRRREIDQLEAELNTLQERLKERESLRARIIERRLRELIGNGR